MTTVLGLTLSLALATGTRGSNGFDPTFLRDIQLNGDQLTVNDHTALDEWLNAGSEEDAKERALAVGYFVACAFRQGIELSVGNGAPWYGQYGLAPGLHQRIALRPRTHLALSPDEGKWVSACLMAFANMKGTHQYILLRGNPPAVDGSRLVPTSGERWTMGYPEGVFFADVLNFNTEERTPASPHLGPIREADRVLVQAATPVGWSVTELEKSFTLSLNLPANYQGIPSAGWAPPNASNGRTLDFEEQTSFEVRRSLKDPSLWQRMLSLLRLRPPSPPKSEKVRVAERLGTFHESMAYFEQESGAPGETNYPFDSACVAKRKLVPCSTQGAVRLRPLFVHSPRVVSLASAIKPTDPSPILQAIFSGTPSMEQNQLKECAAVTGCSGPFKLHATGETPTAPSTQPARTLQGLKSGQSVTTVLRFNRTLEGYDLNPKEAFTAIIRYRSQGQSRAMIEASHPSTPGLRPLGDKWPSTGTDWQWMQVFPVYVVNEGGPGGHPTLKVKISGIGDGAKAPILDVAGFVSGPPWCFDVSKTDPEFSGTCPVTVQGATVVAAPLPIVRRAPTFNLNEVP